METPEQKLARWEGSGYGRAGGSSGDKLFVLKRFVKEGIGCGNCPTPSHCANYTDAKYSRTCEK